MENLTTITVGLDLGDKYSQICSLDPGGDMLDSGRVRTTKLGFEHRFHGQPRARIVVEAGTHSGWVSRQLSGYGHEVIVANPREIALIYKANDKSDKTDSEKLARLGRFDPKLLAPIQHRSERTQIDLAVLRSRDLVVAMRTKLVNHARSMVKGLGERLPSCSTNAFATRMKGKVPADLCVALDPVLEAIGELSKKIRVYDTVIAEMAKRYPAMAKLQEVSGVGALTAAAYVLTLADPTRFKKSRDVGPYIGLVPRKDASGESDPHLHITKAGDTFVRRLLVQSAQYILGHFGTDSDLRRWGLKYAGVGGKNRKKRAVVAVARKLAVLLHVLWTKDGPYRALREGQPAAPEGIPKAGG